MDVRVGHPVSAMLVTVTVTATMMAAAIVVALAAMARPVIVVPRG